MAKKAYIGVSDVARNCSKMYVGVNDVARKVVKGYVGVNGVAQQFWGDSSSNTGWSFWFYYKPKNNDVLVTQQQTESSSTQTWKKTANGIVFYCLAHYVSGDNNTIYDYVVAFSTNQSAYSSITPTMISSPYTKTINGDTWYYGYSTNQPLHNAYRLEPIGCRLPDYITRTELWNSLPDNFLNLIYSDDFAEDYQVGHTYDLVKADIEKTVRKFFGVWLYKYEKWGASVTTLNTAHNLILQNLETVIDYIVQHAGNNDIVLINCDSADYDEIVMYAFYGTAPLTNITIESIDDTYEGYHCCASDSTVRYNSCSRIAFTPSGVNYSNPQVSFDENIYIGMSGMGVDYMQWSNIGLKFYDNHPDVWNTDWVIKNWNGLSGLYNSFYGNCIWSDGDNIYYSYYFSSTGSDQYVLNRATNTWIPKTWNGFSNINGSAIWSDGTNIYYSDGWRYQYVLNKATSTWETKTWSGPVSQYFGINGIDIWTDGTNIYESTTTHQYVLNAGTNVWSNKTWNGLTKFEGRNVWTDGTNIYYSNDDNKQYILDKSTSTWSVMNWNGNTDQLIGNYIWTDGTNIYNSYYSNYQYVLDKSTNTWNTKTWTGLTDFVGDDVWKDGNNIYYSMGQTHCVLVR